MLLQLETEASRLLEGLLGTLCFAYAGSLEDGVIWCRTSSGCTMHGTSVQCTQGETGVPQHFVSGSALPQDTSHMPLSFKRLTSERSVRGFSH